jgi:Ca2+-binding EF-hand superfamily protein
MISVRLSEEEYSSFKELCSVMGARSISDLARDSMYALLNRTDREDVRAISRNEFRTHMKSLDRKLELIAAKIKPSKAAKGR